MRPSWIAMLVASLILWQTSGVGDAGGPVLQTRSGSVHAFVFRDEKQSRYFCLFNGRDGLNHRACIAARKMELRGSGKMEKKPPDTLTAGLLRVPKARCTLK